MSEIGSSQNKNFKKWLSLLESKGVVLHHEALLPGKKVVLEALGHHLKDVKALLMPEKGQFPEIAEFRNLESYRLSPKLFKELDIFGTGWPLALISVPKLQNWEAAQLKGCALYLSQQDPRNVGAMLRSAAAFGVTTILLGPGAAHPFHPLSLRAASGSIFAHKFFKVLKLEDLNHAFSVALDMTGENLADFVFPENFVLIPGVEGPGLDKKFQPARRVNIRTSSDVESLNVMQATTVALYEWSKT